MQEYESAHCIPGLRAGRQRMTIEERKKLQEKERKEWAAGGTLLYQILVLTVSFPPQSMDIWGSEHAMCSCCFVLQVEKGPSRATVIAPHWRLRAALPCRGGVLRLRGTPPQKRKRSCRDNCETGASVPVRPCPTRRSSTIIRRQGELPCRTPGSSLLRSSGPT